MNLKELQNGSDIRGAAMGEEANLTSEAVNALAGAFAIWLAKKKDKSINRICISVGRDSRITGELLMWDVAMGVCARGADVRIAGLASTPAMFMSTIMEGKPFDGAIMITASHLPSDRNGMKFFTEDGSLDKAEISELIQLAEGHGHMTVSLERPLRTVNIMGAYTRLLVNKVRSATGMERPLEGYRIVVDAGNGAGGFFAADVLRPLGADTTGSLYLEPDGTFPHHVPNPEDKNAIEAISRAVQENCADLGVVFDTDVDRAGAVDATGVVFNKNRLIALMSAIALEEEPGGVIVTDSVTSAGLTEFIQRRGGVHHRFKRGYKNVIDESKRLCAEGKSSPLAIETSGHGAFRENYFLDDGAYIIIKILIQMSRIRNTGETLSGMIADLREPVEAAEYRLPLITPRYKDYGKLVIDELTERLASGSDGFFPEENNYEGIRAKCKDGWFLLRMSLHDPLMPLNIESDVPCGLERIRSAVAELLKGYIELDSSMLSQ